MAIIDNLSAYWKMDESSGNIADSSGNSNTGTNVNTTAFATGKINNGADLENASSNYFSVADSASTSITGDLTCNLWFKPESDIGDNQGLLVKRDNTTTNISYVVYITTGLNQVHFVNSTDGTNTNSTDVNVAITALNTGTFYMISLVYTASSGQIEVFINGVSVGTASSAKTSIFNGTAPLRIGSLTDAGGTTYTDGILDEVGLWARALSSTEISQLYNGGAGLAYPFNVPTKGGTLSMMGV